MKFVPLSGTNEEGLEQCFCPSLYFFYNVAMVAMGENVPSYGRGHDLEEKLSGNNNQRT